MATPDTRNEAQAVDMSALTACLPTRAAEEGGMWKKEEASQSRRSEDTEYGPSAAASEEGADREERWNGAEINTQRRVGGHGERSSTGNGVRTETHRFQEAWRDTAGSGPKERIRSDASQFEHAPRRRPFQI
ncbi:hypothetical protein N7527_005162 [Penicillium freii]|nr:hypothetical protein N7527_005162 [Penicillium freii]